MFLKILLLSFFWKSNTRQEEWLNRVGFRDSRIATLENAISSFKPMVIIIVEQGTERQRCS
jgi:hypothetical protein